MDIIPRESVQSESFGFSMRTWNYYALTYYDYEFKSIYSIDHIVSI